MVGKHRFEFPVNVLAGYLLAVLLVSLTTPVVAADAPFPFDTSLLVEVRSIEGLPADVKKFLGRQKTSAEGIADKGERFNRADVIFDDLVPMRRFIAGGAGPSSAVVAYEQGGRGYSIQAVAFVLQQSGWAKVGQSTLRATPHTLRQLLDVLDSEYFQNRTTLMRPVRRDGPDVHVHILADGSCSIEHVSIACSDVGAGLEQKFPRHDCHVLIEVDRRSTYVPVGQALKSIQSPGFVSVEFSHG